jgi:predicted lipoprotein with Yx(FWY)xxD motif
MKIKLLIAVLFITTIFASACSPQTAAAPTQAQPQAPAATDTQALSAPAASGPAVKVGKSDQLGMFLVDSTGMTLYLFLKDTPNASNCYSTCAQNWPPLLVNGNPVAGDGLDASKLGTTTRNEGSKQVTYNGWPLYYFANDKQVGDVKGQGIGKVWYVLSPAGDKVDVSNSAASSDNGYGSSSAATSTPMAMPTATISSAAGDVAVTAGSKVSATIENFTFNPGVLKVHKGTTVTWTNNDSAAHTVTSGSSAFDSGALKNGATFSFTFNDTGTFAYHCKFHSDMTATVIVVP